MQKTEAKDLLDRYLQGTVSEAEKEEIELWYQKLQEEYAWELASDEKEAVGQRMKAAIDKYKAEDHAPVVHSHPGETPRSTHRVHFLKTSWFRYAAAIIVIAGAAAIWYQISHPSHPSSPQATPAVSAKDIAPGSNKAILTLADGSKIILDNAQNGSLAQQGTTRIIKLTNGQLAYQGGSEVLGSSGSAELLYNTIRTPRGGQYRVVLPDGTNAWLNAASSIRFPAVFSGAERSIDIKGEVYLEVSKNTKQPFIVRANGAEIRVLGTSFNINAYEDEEALKTTLVEGSVKVKAGAKEVLLRPGQQVRVNEHTKEFLINSDIDVDRQVAWKNQLFIFNDDNIKSIMRQISRWYDVEVVYDNPPLDKLFIGEISRDVPVSKVLRLLELTRQVHFLVDGKKITVTK